MATSGVHEDVESGAEDAVARCNVCGSTAYRVLYRENVAQIHQVVRCESCGLMYAFPLESPNVANYYVEEETSEKYSWETPQVRHAKIKAKDYEDIDAYLTRYFSGKGRVLEVGSSTGIFLDYMQNKGWEVVGVEPNGSAVSFAKEVFGIETYQATLETAPVPEGSIDAAVMLHVIEHLDDPATVIDAVWRLLKPGGVFVVETPTYDSLMFRILGSRERSIRCNGHIFFFTVKTLGDLLHRHGFRILEHKKVGRTLSVERLLWNIGVISKSSRVQRFFENLSRKWNLEDKLIHLNARDMVRIYCVKE